MVRRFRRFRYWLHWRTHGLPHPEQIAERLRNWPETRSYSDMRQHRGH